MFINTFILIANCASTYTKIFDCICENQNKFNKYGFPGKIVSLIPAGKLSFGVPGRHGILLVIIDQTVMIHVRDLTKIYKDLQAEEFVALDGVNFDAMPGQIFGLLGPNGAGKTTALRILSTVLQPTAGTAKINGLMERNDVGLFVWLSPGFVGVIARCWLNGTYVFTSRFDGLSPGTIDSQAHLTKL